MTTSFPPHTASAGFVCPGCSASVSLVILHDYKFYQYHLALASFSWYNYWINHWCRSKVLDFLFDTFYQICEYISVWLCVGIGCTSNCGACPLFCGINFKVMWKSQWMIIQERSSIFIPFCLWLCCFQKIYFLIPFNNQWAIVFWLDLWNLTFNVL